VEVYFIKHGVLFSRSVVFKECCFQGVLFSTSVVFNKFYECENRSGLTTVILFFMMKIFNFLVLFISDFEFWVCVSCYYLIFDSSSFYLIRKSLSLLYCIQNSKNWNLHKITKLNKSKMLNILPYRLSWIGTAHQSRPGSAFESSEVKLVN